MHDHLFNLHIKANDPSTSDAEKKKIYTAEAESKAEDLSKRLTARIDETILLVLFVGYFCITFISAGFAKVYGSASGYVVALAYLIFTLLLSWVNTSLSKWFNKIIRYCTLGIYALSQIIIVIVSSAKHDAFANFSSAINSSSFEKIMQNCVFNHIVFTMLLFTAVFVYMTFAVDFSSIRSAREKGFTIPMQPPAIDEEIAPEKVRRMLVLRGILFTLVTFLIGAWMTNIMTGKFTFGAVVSFLAIAIIWVIISSMIKTDRHKAIFGNFARTLHLFLFVAYVVVVLTSVPSFGLGTIILLVIHFFSWLVLALIFLFV